MLTRYSHNACAALANHCKVQRAGRLQLRKRLHHLAANGARQTQPDTKCKSRSHSVSITNSKVARALMVSGWSVSRIGRTSSTEGQSSLGFFGGSPLNTG